jgi:hypothetical protein
VRDADRECRSCFSCKTGEKVSQLTGGANQSDLTESLCMEIDFRVTDKKKDQLRALILNNVVEAYIDFLLTLPVKIDLSL